ncbi:hypothetical protein KR222_011194, partial [Zaprionus bogoriensis]
HHHHLRHEQHLRAELAGNSGNRQPPAPAVTSSSSGSSSSLRQAELEQLAMLPGPGQQHHLRHHNRHHAAWEQRVFPALRHQQHRMAPATTTSTTTMATPTASVTDAPPMRVAANLSSASSRYFDRDGIYPAWTQPRSTHAPNWQQLVDSDESDDDEDDADYEDDVDSGAASELAKQMPRYSLFSQKLPEISSDDQDYDVYDQSDVESVTHGNDDNNNNNNRHPSISTGHSKAAAKRNIFDWLFKRDKEKVQPHAQSRLQQQQQHQHQQQVKVQPKAHSSTERPNSLLDDNFPDEEDSNNNNNDEEDSSEAFSNEQWNKIEHEHHLRQQKHQKELQALRESSRYSPLIRGAVGRAAIDNEDPHNNYSPNYIPGVLTHQKVERLGNSEAVLKTRRPYEKSHVAEAKAHLHEVMKSRCQKPQERCIRIDSDPSKIYMPHCTILHRCAEDSGCCPDRTEICAPKTIRDVELKFIVKSPKNHHSTPETLTLANHTECHCVERSSYGMEGMTFGGGVRQSTIFSCNCPRFFEKILQNDGQCRCDCSSSNYDCDFLKRGSEHFSMSDRKCIQQGRCKQPTCQFGRYMEKLGRCPNENEQVHQHQPN